MANPSKRFPWVVQIYISALERWIDLEAYRDEDEAKMQAKLNRKRAKNELGTSSKFRIVKKGETK